VKIVPDRDVHNVNEGLFKGFRLEFSFAFSFPFLFRCSICLFVCLFNCLCVSLNGLTSVSVG
jgi:hypothetical protein